MWIRVLSDKDHWPTPRRMMSFKKGTEQSVKRSIGEAGVSEGWAEEIPAPSSAGTVTDPAPSTDAGTGGDAGGTKKGAK